MTREAGADEDRILKLADELSKEFANVWDDLPWAPGVVSLHLAERRHAA